MNPSNINSGDRPFSTFDETEFPIVKVTLTGKIKTDNDFIEFTEGWLNLYDKNEHFYLVFDTKEMKIVNIKYCLYMALFIRKLHKHSKKSYLVNSKIYIYNKFIFNLLKIIFELQKPVAPVNILLFGEQEESIKNYWIYP